MNLSHSAAWPAILVAAVVSIAAHAQSGSSTQEKSVEVERVVVTPASPGEKTTGEKAADLWQKTKTETGEAASTAAEYSKVQGKRAVEGTKKGVAKGAEAVADGSKKAWDATKSASKKAATATVTAVEKTGAAISDALKSEDQHAPVTERSIE